MTIINRYRSIFLLILFFTSAMFLVSHFTKAGSSNLFEGVRYRKATTDLAPRSKVARDRVVLVKNDSVTVNDCRLVYRGMEDAHIRLDLYLLELDPQYAYPQTIPKSAAREGVRLGDTQYKLISSDSNKIWLKISNLYAAK